MRNLRTAFTIIGLVSLVHLNAMSQTRIIIKLDDLGSKNGQVSAPAAMDYLLKNDVKAGLGVIANKLDASAGAAYKDYLAAKASDGKPLFEIWNHGLDHSNTNPPGNLQEFKGTSYDFQLDHLQKADRIVKELLGVDMTTFGSPYNATDENTIRALKALKHYKVFLFSGTREEGSGDLKFFNNRVNMEITTGKVDYENFLKEFDRHKEVYKDVMVLQGHPNMWDEHNLQQFDQVVKFLRSQNCVFVLPNEYYLARYQK